MAKQGIEAAAIRSVFQSLASTKGWALCVGAGTSLPVFPTWQNLVRRLVARDPTALPTRADSLLSSYSPDALIEAARHRFKLTDDKFARLLTEKLYADFKHQAADEWRNIVNCLEAVNVANVNRDGWSRFLSFFESYPQFRTASALSLAAVMAQTLPTDASPVSILSFNAEPLLYALISAWVARLHDWDRGGGVLNAPKQPLDKLARATSGRTRGRVPYVFCHGLLGVPDGYRHRADSASADKLVFSEEQYLTLANAVVSWQSTAFVETCMSRAVVFVGVSLSDPNMRNWLSRVAQNRTRELHDVHGHDGDSTAHFWLNEHPGTPAEAEWIENTVGHLGIRLVWLND